MALQKKIIFLVILVQHCLCNEKENDKLRIALYNYLPDLACDQLESYRKYVEDRFSEYVNGSIEIEAIIDKSMYEPYSPLETFRQYLSNESDGFDLVEIDTLSLSDLVNNNLLLPIETSLSTDYFPAAVKASKYKHSLYAYPTLLCGNFILSAGPISTNDNCDLRSGRRNFSDLLRELNKCSEEHITKGQFNRLLAGKMNDEYGWYLPSIYLDGYIDMYGVESLQKGVNELLEHDGNPDQAVCQNLNSLYNFCGTQRPNYSTHENKCFSLGGCHESTYVQDSKLIYEDVVNQNSRFIFGFSETISQVFRKTGQSDKEGTLISPSMGKENNMLMFTDGLVINRAMYKDASEKKKVAIKAFIDFFTGEEFRTDFLMGKDLPGEHIRYLLSPVSSFYNIPEVKDNKIYQDALFHLESAIPNPTLTEVERQRIQDTLIKNKCIRISHSIAVQPPEEPPKDISGQGTKLISMITVLITTVLFLLLIVK